MDDRVVVLVGTGKGAFFFHSDGRRRDWRLTGPHLAGWEVYSLLGQGPAGGNGNGAPGRVLAGAGHFVYGATVRVSEDLGETWTQIEHGPRYAEDSGFKLKKIWQIVPGHPSQPGTLYAGVDEAGLFVSRDGGASWSEVDALTKHPTRPNWNPGGGGLCLHTIVVDPTNPDRLWVGISAVGVFRTDDGGRSWKTCNTGLPNLATGSADADVCHCVHKIVLDPTDPARLFMQYHGGVFKSTDRGDSWQRIEDGLSGNFGFPMVMTRGGDLFVIPMESDEQRYAKGGRLRVYRSRDRGGSWRPLDRGLDAEPRYVGVLRDAMDADPLEPAGVYFGTTMGEVFFSRDAGDSWERLPGQFPRVTAVKVWAR